MVVNQQLLYRIYRTGLWLVFFIYFCLSSYLLIFQRVRTLVSNYWNGISINPYVYIPSTGASYFETFLANSNLIPFKNTFRYLMESDNFSFQFIFNNIVGNILVFLPLGLLLPLLFRQYKRFPLLFATVTCLTILVEITQITLHIGQFDVDDVILNIIGGMIGFLLAKLLADKAKVKSQLIIG
ncbi:VanZ family protein [Gracilibacillus xinjiangensis]|uniref:VanZ family protein n=1 Tax=Gracilibacillus xinjiangensis TaxID=1193282 RepID=A0ABV8WQD5_9BACI